MTNGQTSVIVRLKKEKGISVLKSISLRNKPQKKSIFLMAETRDWSGKN